MNWDRDCKVCVCVGYSRALQNITLPPFYTLPHYFFAIRLICNPKAMSRTMTYKNAFKLACMACVVFATLSQIQLISLSIEPQYSGTDQSSVCHMSQCVRVQVVNRISWVQSLLWVTFSVFQIVAFCVWTYRAFFCLKVERVLSSHARTLGSWVQIPLKVRMFVYVFILFVLACM
jgi:hypothetical protein